MRRKPSKKASEIMQKIEDLKWDFSRWFTRLTRAHGKMKKVWNQIAWHQRKLREEEEKMEAS
jgi:hypothetical protein